MGRLTTHVLDTASGRPGQSIAINLYRLTEAGADLVKTAITNADGRVDGALLEGADMVPGLYQLEFAVGDYFRAQDVALTEPAFLDYVPIRFGLADADAHYHVPLLISPYGYSTYRGS